MADINHSDSQKILENTNILKDEMAEMKLKVNELAVKINSVLAMVDALSNINGENTQFQSKRMMKTSQYSKNNTPDIPEIDKTELSLDTKKPIKKSKGKSTSSTFTTSRALLIHKLINNEDNSRNIYVTEEVRKDIISNSKLNNNKSANSENEWNWKAIAEYIYAEKFSTAERADFKKNVFDVYKKNCKQQESIASLDTDVLGDSDNDE